MALVDSDRIPSKQKAAAARDYTFDYNGKYRSANLESSSARSIVTLSSALTSLASTPSKKAITTLPRLSR